MSNSKKKKFIIIQIDALPYSIIKRFLKKGSCKFMNRLIEKEGYHLHKFNCGIPTGTPFVQAGIMYNDNSMIPGFRFVDKKKRKLITFGSPISAKYAEERFFRNKKGLLKGGSSYANCLSGGASRSLMTISTMLKNSRPKRSKKGNRWLFLFFYPTSTLRIIYYTIAELWIEVISLIIHSFMHLLKSKQKKAIFNMRIPLRKFFLNVLLVELITIDVIRDIKQGIPKIYANYINFDDISHLRRPNSLAARFMVRALDRRIKRIYRHAREKYDFFILSDHGQVDAVPFAAMQGMTLKEFVLTCAKEKRFGLPEDRKKKPSLISLARKKTFSFLKGLLVPPFEEFKYRFNFDDKNGIFVTDSCSLAHIYFNFSKERIDLSGIRRKHPGLVEKLANNRYIGFVMAKQGNDVILIGGNNRITIKDSSVSIKGQNFLKGYGDDSLLVKQFREFNKLKFVGDLVLFGRYENGLGVSFTNHVGTHNGIGGDMSWPFLLSKKKYDFSKTMNAKDLHKIFKGY